MVALPQTATPPSRPILAGAPEPFATVKVVDALEAVRTDWAELEEIGGASPYQAFAFAKAWFETVGAAQRAAPVVVTARDEAGRAVALIPLAVRRWGPVAIASFPGGRDSNFNLGLFRPGVDWREAGARALLTAAGRAGRIDAFALFSQPCAWDGRDNPLALLGGAPSPSFGARCALPATFDAWAQSQLSKGARKKARQGAAALARLGAVAHVVARTAAEADSILDACLAQKRALAAAGGPPNPYAKTPAEAFLRRLAHEGVMELQALTVNGRPVATFGGLSKGGHLSGLLLSHDAADREIARLSPGALLLAEVVRTAIGQGLTAFDLGVGEAAYKDRFCPIPEPLVDVAFGVTPLGWVAAAAIRAARRAKRAIKRSPRLYALANWTRGRRRRGRGPRI